MKPSLGHNVDREGMPELHNPIIINKGPFHNSEPHLTFLSKKK